MESERNPQQSIDQEFTGSSDPPPQGGPAFPESAAPDTYPQVTDVDGLLWDVRETRPTKHGFDIYFGYPSKPLLRKRKAVGKFRLVVTTELVAYWESHYTDDAAIYDLPVGRKTIDRVHRRACFKIAIYRRSTRRRRTPSPPPPSIREFARQYGISVEDAHEWHMFLLDPTPRPSKWWYDPAPLAVLRSSLTLREMGETLGISSTYANRLRQRALALNKSKFPRISRLARRSR